MSDALDIRWLRNVANAGRGSAMTEALHAAADEIERLTAENQHLRQTATCSVSAALHEAALAELRGENERLIAERDACKHMLSNALKRIFLNEDD